MRTQTVLQTGQQLARTRWGTHESGDAFDRKKSPYLTERAEQFITQQVMCVIAGLTPDDRLDGVLVLGQPGFVQVLDASTCQLRLEHEGRRASGILQRVQQALSMRGVAWLSLFFICHPTRERLCVHATVEMLANDSSPSSAPSVVVCLHVQEAFFHCSKYIRTRVAGLTVPVSQSSFSQEFRSSQDRLKGSQRGLFEEHCRFLSQQVLCFLCTVNREGRCAVNHRGGAPGFLVPFSASEAAPGGIVFLPDFAGNGAFEAIGNILETEQVALVVPNYAAQMALCISGRACVVEPEDLPVEVAQQCIGAERVIALAVQHIEVQSGDWSGTLEYECTRAASIWSNTPTASTCTL